MALQLLLVLVSMFLFGHATYAVGLRGADDSVSQQLQTVCVPEFERQPQRVLHTIRIVFQMIGASHAV